MIPPTPDEWARMSAYERAAFHQAWQMQEMMRAQLRHHHEAAQLQERRRREARKDRDRVVNTLVWIFVLGPLLLFMGVGLVILVII